MMATASPLQCRTVVQLYRTLLRLSKQFDAQPTAKTLIYRNTVQSETDQHTQTQPSHPFTATKADPLCTTRHYNEMLDLVLQRRFLYLPSPSPSPSLATSSSTPSPSPALSVVMPFVDIVRNEFRRETYFVSIEERIDAAFALLRKFSMVWYRYENLAGEEDSSQLEQPLSVEEVNEEVTEETTEEATEEVTARDVEITTTKEENREVCEARYDEKIKEMKSSLSFVAAAELKPGILLAAHPLLTGSLHRTVILILEHNDKVSYGVVINRPTSHTLKSAVKNLPQEFTSKFGDCHVSFGGMVRRLQLIHSISNCGGTLIPNCSQPLYAGGSINKALSYAKKSPNDVNNFKFFVGCCCWDAKQLESEVNSGYWISAEAQPDQVLALSHISNNESTSADDNRHDSKIYQFGRSVESDVDVYQVMLDALGHDYQKLADIPAWLDSTMVESCDWNA